MQLSFALYAGPVPCDPVRFRVARSRAVLTAHHQRGRRQRDETIGFDERRRFLKTDFDDTMTLRQFLRHAAARAEMALTTDYGAMIRLYIGYLRDAGFLTPLPETVAL